MHCLIVRGEAGAYVRRWAPDTRLNGTGFDDAVLRSGDRLSIGPIEFCVVETGSETPHNGGCVPTASAIPSDGAETGPLATVPPHGSSGTSPADAGRDTERPPVSADSDAVRAELEKQKRLLQDEWAALNDRRQQFESHCRETLDAEEAAEARLLAKRANLEQWELRLTQAQHSLSDKLNEVEQQLLALAAEREDLERARCSLDAERSRFAAESDETDRRLTAQASELTRQRIELSRQQEELELLRRQVRDQQAAWQEQSRSKGDEEGRIVTAADPADAAPIDNIAGAGDDMEESAVEQDVAAVVTVRRTSGVPVASEDDSTADGPFVSEHPSSGSEAGEQHERGRPAGESEKSELRLEDVLRRLGRHENDQADDPSADETDGAEAKSCEHSRESNSENSPHVGRRRSSDTTGFSVLRDSEESDDAGLNGQGQSNRWLGAEIAETEPEELASPPADRAAHTEGRRKQGAAGSGSEASGEDDIDAYMADLMRRLGKSHQPAPRQQSTDPQPRRNDSQDHERQQKPTATAKADEEPETERRPLTSLAPRAVAPEKQLNMGAMRELANQSTRSALDQHAWRSLWQNARSHLAMTATMGAVGLGLLWLHFFWIANTLALFAGLIVLGFGGFLLLQYAYTACRLLTCARRARNADAPDADGSAEQAADTDEAVDALDEQATGPSRIDLGRLDALVAHTRARGAGTEASGPTGPSE